MLAESIAVNVMRTRAGLGSSVTSLMGTVYWWSAGFSWLSVVTSTIPGAIDVEGKLVGLCAFLCRLVSSPLC
ncbi:hypothetical protein ACFFQF_23680 [Haladaptatus pallidirubidus]|uniref:hypothetical protein n=1 Tax=Haladaptatus pallidirubidus TaxID=1008152 RepID=UPI001D115797|nr:hypothetical protein [Haladaptatus pallidirubidus]